MNEAEGAGCRGTQLQRKGIYKELPLIDGDQLVDVGSLFPKDLFQVERAEEGDKPIWRCDAQYVQSLIIMEHDFVFRVDADHPLLAVVHNRLDIAAIGPFHSDIFCQNDGPVQCVSYVRPLRKIQKDRASEATDDSAGSAAAHENLHTLCKKLLNLSCKIILQRVPHGNNAHIQ